MEPDTLSPFGPGSGQFNFLQIRLGLDSGSFSFSPLIVPIYAQSSQGDCNTDYIINITHRLRNTQSIFARISIQVTVDHAEQQGEFGACLLKVPNALGKAAFWIIHAFDDNPDSFLKT